MDKTINVNGRTVTVTAQNWQSVAAERLAQDSALSPANRLAEYQAIQALAGASGPRNFSLDANGAAVANTAADDAILASPLVRAADAVESTERSYFGAGAATFLHNAGETLGENLVRRPLAAGEHFLSDTLPAWLKDAAANVKAALGAGNTTLQIGLIAVAVVGGAIIVMRFRK
jgi:hypothetical protein